MLILIDLSLNATPSRLATFMQTRGILYLGIPTIDLLVQVQKTRILGRDIEGCSPAAINFDSAMKREERFQFKVAARAGPAPPFLVQQHCYPYIYCYRHMLSLSRACFC